MFPERRSFDVVVLGGGPAGIMGAMTAANCGAAVALVDSHTEAGAMLAGTLETSEAAVFRGVGSFAGANTIRVRPAHSGEEVYIHAHHVLITAGTSPVRPDIFPFGRPGIYESDGILELSRLPKRLAVIGAGVIGSEYARTFAALGTEVHLIDGHHALPPFADGELSVPLAWEMARAGVEFHWNERVESCRVAGDNVILRLRSGALLECDAVLVAAGRRSNAARLRLAAAGLKADEHGLIRVDGHYRTAVPHIYAAGDIAGSPSLASTSMQQARMAMYHAFGRRKGHGSRLRPGGVDTTDEGTIGETEESLRRKGVDYVVGRWQHRSNATGRTVGGADGFLKLLFQREDLKLIGVHLTGEHAAELVHIGMMAMLAGVTAEQLAGLRFNLPTLGELYKTAATEAMGALEDVQEACA